MIIAVVAGAFALTGSAGSNISPVADQIAYMSMLDGEADIYTMAPTGLLNFNLTHDKTTGMRADVEPAWSPDGQHRRIPAEFPEGDSWGSQLYLVATDGTKLGPADAAASKASWRCIPPGRPTARLSCSPATETATSTSTPTGRAVTS